VTTVNSPPVPSPPRIAETTARIPPPHDGKQQRRTHQFEGGGNPLGDHRRDRPAGHVAPAEIEPYKDLPEPHEVLYRQGPIEPVVLPDAGDVFSGRLRIARNYSRRPSRREMQQRECDDRHKYYKRHRHRKSLDYARSHHIPLSGREKDRLPRFRYFSLDTQLVLEPPRQRSCLFKIAMDEIRSLEPVDAADPPGEVLLIGMTRE